MATLPKQVADYIILVNGRATTIECKSSKNPVSYDLISFIKPHQVTEAIEWKRHGGSAYFFICRRSDANYMNHVVYVFHPETIESLRVSLERQGHNSMKWGDLGRHAIMAILRDKTGWVLDAFIEKELPDLRGAKVQVGGVPVGGVPECGVMGTREGETMVRGIQQDQTMDEGEGT